MADIEKHNPNYSSQIALVAEPNFKGVEFDPLLRQAIMQQ